MSNRRKFIQQSFLGISGSALLPVIGNASSHSVTSTEIANAPLQIGMAGYSFAKFSLDQSIAMMKRIGLSNMSLKEMHLPLNSTDAQISSAIAKYKAAGINIYTVGVIYMKTKEAVDNTFAYAKKCGVNMIVGVPNYELIEYAEQKVKEYDIKLAMTVVNRMLDLAGIDNKSYRWGNAQ